VAAPGLDAVAEGVGEAAGGAAGEELHAARTVTAAASTTDPVIRDLIPLPTPDVPLPDRTAVPDRARRLRSGACVPDARSAGRAVMATRRARAAVPGGCTEPSRLRRSPTPPHATDRTPRRVDRWWVRSPL
jgi:hypothetical protein